MRAPRTRTSCIRSSGGRSSGSRKWPSKPTARSRSPRAQRRRWRKRRAPTCRPSRRASQVPASVPITTSGRREGEVRTLQRSGCSSTSQQRPMSPEPDLHGGAVVLLGAEVALRERGEGLLDPAQAVLPASTTAASAQRYPGNRPLGLRPLPPRFRRQRLASARAQGADQGHPERRAARARPAAEVGIYACGPTVYSRIHIGNARPFVVFSLLARFLRTRGLPRRGWSINVTDVNDKIYDAARPRRAASAEFARRDDRRLRRGHRPARARPARRRAAGDRDDGADRRPDRGLVEAGHAYESGGDVYFRVAQLRRLRQALQPRHRGHGPGRGGRHRVAEGGPARLRALEGARRRARTPRWDSPWGRGPAGLAHRVLGDGRGRAGPDVRDPRRRLRPRLPPPRERDRPVRGRAGARSRGSGCTTGWSRPAPRRCRSPRATSSSSRGARPLRARGGRRLPALRPLPPAAGLRRGAAAARRRRGSSGCATSSASIRPGEEPGDRGPSRRAAGARSSTRSPTTSTRRRRWPRLFDLVAEANRREVAGAGERPRRDARRCSGSASSPRPGRRPPTRGAAAAGASARRRARERDFERADELRDRLAEMGWEVRDSAEGARARAQAAEWPSRS